MVMITMIHVRSMLSCASLVGWDRSNLKDCCLEGGSNPSEIKGAFFGNGTDPVKNNN